jgi:serine/threonine protein kinase
MAPEQWEDRPTYATDQYALAIMAYELLVGHPPFQGRPEVVMLHHLQKLPAAPSSQNTTLTPALDAVLLRALAKRPEDRFPSVSAFADALCEAVKTMTTSSAGAIAEHVTLAISDSEALHGTRRTLEIGGEAVDVVIPPHVQHGQVIHLVGERRASAGQQTALPLQLKLEVLTDTPTVQAPEASSPTLNAAPTVLALPEKEILIQEKTIATPEPVSSTAHGKQTLSPPASDGKSRPARPRTRTSTMVFRVITLALLLLMLTGGSGWLLYQSGRLHSLDTSQHGHQNATATAQAQLSSNATATAQAQLSSNATATAIASLPQLSIDKEKLAASAGNSSDDCSYSSSALVLNDHTYAGWSCPLTLSNSGSQNLNWSSQTASAVGSRSSGESGWLNIWSGSLDAGDVAVFPTNGTIQPNGTQSVTVIVIDSSDGTSCPATGYDITFSGPANEISVEWGCS